MKAFIPMRFQDVPDSRLCMVSGEPELYSSEVELADQGGSCNSHFFSKNRQDTYFERAVLFFYFNCSHAFEIR